MLFIKKAKLAPGWALIRVIFDTIQKIAPKVKGAGALSRMSALSQDYKIHNTCLVLLSRHDEFERQYLQCLLQQLRTMCCFHAHTLSMGESLNLRVM